MSDSAFDFDRAVIQNSFAIPVLVDFWAPWCAPCRALTPLLETVAARMAGRFELVKVNTEEYPAIAQQYGVRGIPNVKLFVDGAVADEFTGALPESALEAWLQRALPSPYREQLKRAEGLLGTGRSAEAEPVLRHILAAEPGNERAAILLAQLLLKTSPDEALAAVKAIGPDSDQSDAAEALRTLARLFGLLEHPERLDDAPAKSAYLEAIRNIREENYEPALRQLIELVRQARGYDEDGARKACVAIFRLLGDGHELTRSYRGQLSNALYV
ncbi:tetratricopeptide repeat protein [Methylococcus geothermalis]|uniref:Tetratricopeptide repeat protein n=1 Tax=Methylococcus geothermalis TaxID=2681310 RepID=A0A858Q3Z3_9GAMM|nr:tetratricopeptide repeat protein [Methylococcus geothermalis]QJD28538.1 tetratricopeptide repeat protein [Methylococcus geothermalis]